MRMRRILPWPLLGAFGLVPQLASQTVNQPMTWAGTANTSVPAASDVVRNVGQTSHIATYCYTGPTSGTHTSTAELEGSFDNSTWQAISAIGSVTVVGATTNCTTISGSGYFPDVRLNVLTLPGGSGSPLVTAQYSGSSLAVPIQGLPRFGQAASAVLPAASAAICTNSALLSTPITCTATAAGVTGLSVYNPNASAVYFFVTTGVIGQQVEVGVAAGATVATSFPIPLDAQDNVKIQCSTAVGGSGDPATGCVANVYYLSLATVNSGINAAGTVTSTVTSTTP